jgi:predicted methyltransferase
MDHSAMTRRLLPLNPRRRRGGASPAARRPRCGLLLAAVAFLAGCRSSAPAPPPAAEASVRPGINAEFAGADLNAEQWTERFEREGREVYDRREALREAAQLRPGLDVADIGAGSGLFTLPFAAAVGPQGKVYAVDIAPEFLAVIARRAAAAGQRNVVTVQGNDRSVPLAPGSVDLAFICDTYHHFEYPQQVLASIHRALRRDGQMLLVDFRRIPGQSSDWILQHVRAGQEAVTAEIEQAGFVLVEELPLLRDNYVLRFRKAAR